MFDVSCLLAALSLFGAGVSFSVAHPQGRGIARQAITVGVALPEAFWDGECGLIVRGGDAGAGPVDARPLCHHDDGSVRFVALTFPLSLRPGRARRLRLVRGDDPPRPGFRVERHGDGIQVIGDEIQCSVPLDPTRPFTTLGPPRARPVVRSLPMGVTVDTDPLVVEVCGRYLCTILQSGRVRYGDAVFRQRRRVTVRQPGTIVEVETWLESTDWMGVMEPIAWRGVMAGPVDRVVTVDGESSRLKAGASLEGSRRGDPILVVDGEGGRTGGEALSFRHPHGSLHVAVRDLARYAAGGIRCDGAGHLVVTLVGADYHWWPGVRAGRAVRFTLRSRRSRRPPASFIVPVAVQRARDDPDFARVMPPRPVAAPAGLGDRLDAALDAPDRNGLDWRGEENAGDWRWSRTAAGNLEYDTSWGLAYWGRVREAPRLLAWADRAARHLVSRDLDLEHTGLPLRHGAWHRRGGVEAGHVWLDGLMASYHRTGDRFLGDAIDGLRVAWRRYATDTRVRRWNTRSLGWGLHAASALARHEGGEADRALVTRILGRITDTPGDDLHLANSLAAGGHVKRVPVWVEAGIVGSALAEAGAAGASAARMKRSVERLERETLRGRIGPVVRALHIDEPTGETVGHDGECTGEEALFLALGSKLWGDDRPERRRLVKDAAEALRFDEKTLIGLELSQLLWLWPRLFKAP